MSTFFQELLSTSDKFKEIFNSQGKKALIVKNYHIKTDKFSNISKDELNHLAETLTSLAYATPVYDDYFYIFEHKIDDVTFNKELIIFAMESDLQEFKQKNNCPFIYLTFRDILLIVNDIGLDTVTFNLGDYYLSFSSNNISTFYNIFIYENNNPSSKYIIGEPSESYEKAIEILKKKFINFPELHGACLYHIYEAKNKQEAAANDEYDSIYDLIVVDTKEKNLREINEIINNTVKETNNHSIKVVLKESDMGMFLSNNEIKPFYTINN